MSAGCSWGRSSALFLGAAPRWAVPQEGMAAAINLSSGLAGADLKPGSGVDAEAASGFHARHEN